MGRLRSKAFCLAVAILSLWSVSGCGGGKKAGTPIFPGRVSLSPSSNTSLTLGGTLNFAASVQTTTGTNISTPITFSSSDSSVLTLAANGVACAGHWDVNFTICTPGATGAVQVTASALGASSVPTWVFVHPAIDTITVNGILLDGVPVQEPCLSQSQSMTVEAHAYSQGTDITSTVGPFTWSANNSTVVNLIPLPNSNYNFPTNQATATANFPGITQIYASAGGVTSSAFQQPQYQNSLGSTSPALDFFATCAIQSISLELGTSTTQQSGETTFVTSKGTTQNVTSVLTDVMGHSSLPNTNGDIVLSKIPLTWTASQPGVLAVGTSCLDSCALSTPLPGAGTITASCSPPTCNIGFPVVPASLSTPAAVEACTNFFTAQYPKLISCQQLIPVPVYASPLPSSLIASSCVPSPDTDCPGVGAISGVITGSTTSEGVLAASNGCAHEAPSTCTVGIYDLATSKASTGIESPSPTPPNSLRFTLAGDKAYMGSDYGAQIVNPSNFGTSNSPFTSLGTVTGQVLATSTNGSLAVFSDTIRIPNQTYVVNSATSTALTATPLNISAASIAAFSPDGLKTFIIGGSNATSLYVYSSLQALQGPFLLAGPANALAFSPNGAFAFVAESASTTSPANLTAFSTCNNQPALTSTLVPVSVPLPANALFMRVLPGLHIDGRDSVGNAIPDGIHIFILDATGFDVITFNISAPTSPSLCNQLLDFSAGSPQRIELGQGTLQPVNFFASADAAQLYVATADKSSILVFDFGTGAVSGIALIGNATPVTADMSIDAGTIVVSGSDGMFHQISTALGGSDQVQLAFPNLPNSLNPFCTITPAAGPCSLNLLAIRP